MAASLPPFDVHAHRLRLPSRGAPPLRDHLKILMVLPPPRMYRVSKSPCKVTNAPKKECMGRANPVKLPSQCSQEAHGDRQIKQGTEPPNADARTALVSISDNREVSAGDIELVLNLIGSCLQMYMNQGEVVTTLMKRARIDHGFTTLVWQKLEEENPDFFRAYYIRVKLKEQIILFNHLLEHQLHLMNLNYQAQVLHVQNRMHPMSATNLPIDYPVMHHQPMPTSDQHHVESMNHDMSSCHVVNDIPAPHHFQHIHGNIANDNGKRKRDELSDVPDMAIPASAVSRGHFTPSDTSGMDMDMLAQHTPFSSDVGAGSSKDLSLEQICWDFSVSDVPTDLTPLEDFDAGTYTGAPSLVSDFDLFLESSGQDEIVNGNFASNAPSPCRQIVEEKS